MATQHIRSVILTSLAVIGLALTCLFPIAPAGSEEGPAGAPNQAASVDLVGFHATPEHLEITTGTTVTWTNKEIFDYPLMSGRHEIKADDGSFASPSLAPGTRWSHRFNRPGTFTYHCVHHPDLAGQLVVTGDAIGEAVEKEVGITEDKPDDPTSWGFVPDDLVIETGSSVVWRNNGTNTHTVTSDGSFNSGDLKPGETFKRVFDSPGVFTYHCTPHPWMKAM